MSISNQPAGKREKAAERRVKALELRQRGLSYRKIGAELGVSECQAHNDVRQALEKLAALEIEQASSLRALELARLDEIQEGIYEQAINGDLFAIDRILKVLERRSRLLGLDAPTKTELSGNSDAPLRIEVQYIDGASDGVG